MYHRPLTDGFDFICGVGNGLREMWMEAVGDDTLQPSRD
jgi:hypothetical protein